MPPLRAGQEIDAWCTKCKLDLTHRIIAVADGKPARVECRTCYSTHNYRAPKSGAVAAVQRPARSAAAPSSASPATPRAPRARASAEEHAAVVPPPGAKVHSYRMTERFMKDQWIVHKVFGNGIVTAELADDKIEVRFDSGPKTLVHNRSE